MMSSHKKTHTHTHYKVKLQAAQITIKYNYLICLKGKDMIHEQTFSKE